MASSLNHLRGRSVQRLQPPIALKSRNQLSIDFHVRLSNGTKLPPSCKSYTGERSALHSRFNL